MFVVVVVIVSVVDSLATRIVPPIVGAENTVLNWSITMQHHANLFDDAGKLGTRVSTAVSIGKICLPFGGPLTRSHVDGRLLLLII